ncbi:Arc family DNA-binding protein [Pseudomonas sp. JH-2]|uniref:Arc family DNA-binding protein n=1 Tax=Pseudomonas sp. JH-2 TaxID=3114998 RepID=UPI003FA73244
MEKRQIASYPLRLEPRMRAKVQEEANRNRRSLNAELIVLIEEGLNVRAKQTEQE